MTEILTESFCERCGTRYTFESAVPGSSRLGGLKVLGRGLRQFVMSDSTSLDEAIASARSDSEHDATNDQLDAFHKTFHFCMSCRQYTCANCWNEAEARCQSCAPIEVAGVAPGVMDGNGSVYLNGLVGLEAERDHGHIAGLNTSTPFAPISAPAASVETVTPGEPAIAVESIAADASIAPAESATPARDLVEGQGLMTGSPEPATDPAVDDAWSALPTGSYFDATRTTAGPIGMDSGPESTAEVDAQSGRSDTTEDPAPERVADDGIAPVAEPSGSVEARLVAESAPEADLAPMPEPVDALELAFESSPRAVEGAVDPNLDAVDPAPWPPPAIISPVVAMDMPAIPSVTVEPPMVTVIPLPVTPVAVPPVPVVVPPAPVAATVAAPPAPVAVPASPAEPPAPVLAPAVPVAPVAATKPPAAKSPAAAPQWPTGPRWPNGSPGDASDPVPVDALAALMARKSTDAMWAQANLPLLQPPAAAAPAAAVKACGNCGTSLSANARFCRRCGTSQA